MEQITLNRFDIDTPKKAIPKSIWALTICAFAIGTTEFVAVGILPAIASDLHVNLSSTGLIVSMYALGVAFGGPILTAITGHIDRKKLLISLMLLFIAGHIVSALAPGFTFLLAARFVSGFSHAAFFGVGSTIATSIVPPNKKATAIALMFTGLTVAIIAGVPLGTFVGQHGGWRITFFTVAALGAAGCLASMILLPNTLGSGRRLSLKQQLAVIKNPHILLVLAITAFGYGGTFVPFTYVATILETVSGFSASSVGFLLLIYGLAIALGNMVGGKISNTNPAGKLIWLFMVQAIILLIFSLTMHDKWLSLITLMCMGFFSFASVPGLQLYIVQLSEKYLPGTEDISASLNIAAFNIGVAIGSYAGGLTVGHAGLGLAATPWIGAAIVLLGTLLTYCSYNMQKKG